MSADDAPPHDIAYAPGGMIPPGVLDPSIVTLSPPTNWGEERFSASESPTFDRAARDFFTSLWRRVDSPLGGFWRGGEIARRHHDTFVREITLPRELPPIISDERIEELYVFMGLNSEPGERRRSYDLEEKVKEVTPQFFLRNVKRAELETNPHRPPYHIEIWRDPIVPPRDFPTQVVLTYIRPEMTFEISSGVSVEEREKMLNLLMRDDWAEQWGNWWQETERPKIDMTWFPTSTIKRVRGRFANEEEARQEAEAKNKMRKQTIHFTLDNPDGVWSDQFKR